MKWTYTLHTPPVSICTDYAPYFLKCNLNTFPVKQKQYLCNQDYILLKCMQHYPKKQKQKCVKYIFTHIVWHFKLWKSVLTFVYLIRSGVIIQLKSSNRDTKHAVTRPTVHGWHHNISEGIFTSRKWYLPVHHVMEHVVDTPPSLQKWDMDMIIEWLQSRRLNTHVCAHFTIYIYQSL